MHSNGMLPLDTPLDAPLDARCGYILKPIQIKAKVEAKAKVVFDVCLFSLISFAFAFVRCDRQLGQAEANLFPNGHEALQSKLLSL